MSISDLHENLIERVDVLHCGGCGDNTGEHDHKHLKLIISTRKGVRVLIYHDVIIM